MLYVLDGLLTGRIGIEERGQHWHALLELDGQPQRDERHPSRALAELRIESFRALCAETFDEHPVTRGMRWRPARCC